MTTADAARELAADLARARAAWPGTRWKTPAVAADRQKPDHLPAIIELYRDGCAYGEIAEQIGLSRSDVSNRIRDARAAGRWPAELRRRP